MRVVFIISTVLAMVLLYYSGISYQLTGVEPPKGLLYTALLFMAVAAVTGLIDQFKTPNTTTPS